MFHVPITIVGFTGSMIAEAEDGSGMRLMPPSFTFSLDKMVRIVRSKEKFDPLQHNIGEVLAFCSADLESFQTLCRDPHLYLWVNGGRQGVHAIQYLNISETITYQALLYARHKRHVLFDFCVYLSGSFWKDNN
jgi:hypothetical protein